MVIVRHFFFFDSLATALSFFRFILNPDILKVLSNEEEGGGGGEDVDKSFALLLRSEAEEAVATAVRRTCSSSAETYRGQDGQRDGRIVMR